MEKKNHWKAWLYLAPAIVLLLVFTVWPIINTLRMAFLEGYDMGQEIGGASFSFGFDNFVNVVEFYRFKSCMLTTILLTVITVPISTMLALVIAVALNSIKFVKKTFQTIFFLPYVTNTIAIGMVFMAMFNRIPVGDTYSYGIINNVIQAFGGEPINWINGGSSYAANIAVLSIYIIWNALPFKILVLLGGLQGVDKQYYDAAKIDGTSRFRTFWRITVPLLSPMIAYVVITGFIGGFKEYSSVLGIFGPAMGPGNHEVDTMVGLIYASVGEQQGQASAAALILFVIIFAVTMVNMYVSKKKVHY
ncbi:MAG: sugar ABC transporter permease [Clostridia bacterium]|nr:sugar ABC transporter permease [Clostridia bacterium]